MIQSILVTGTQIIILMLLISVGYLCGRFKMFDDNSISALSEFALVFVSPCAIFESFLRDYNQSMLFGIALVFVITILVHTVSILLSKAIIRGNDSTSRVLRYGVVFGNCGYMGLPLQQMLVGSMGVFYGAVYIGSYNLIQWTYGIIFISGDRKNISLKKLINPNLIAVFLGIIFFLFSIPVPYIIKEPISYLAALNVPIPMAVIGYYLSQADLINIWKKIDYYKVCALRLVIIPLALIGILRAVNIDPEIALSCVISTGVPVAAATTMLSVLYKQDSETAANLVSISTVFSIITLPIMVAITNQIF